MRRWADVLIVAPASANVIAKAAYGISDNFVLSVIRAWDFNKPCAICPAMNTVMWTHPTTKESLDRLQSWGWEVLGPVEKMLACNDRGMGAMVSLNEIKAFLVSKFFARPQGGGADDTPHELTNSNLQLHSLLLNASGSTNTTVESKDKNGGNKAGAKDETPHAEDANFKKKLISMPHASIKHAHSTTVGATAAVSNPEGTVPDDKKKLGNLSSNEQKSTADHSTGVDKAPAKGVAVPAPAPAVKKTYYSYAFQSLMLGMGLGVGIVVSQTLLSYLIGGGRSGDFLYIRPGAGKQATI